MSKKKKDDAEALEQLMKLTKLMKAQKVKVSKLGPPRSGNKWRSQEPKFTERTDPKSETVEAGGMQVDPSLKDEYEAWRKEKEAERQGPRKLTE